MKLVALSFDDVYERWEWMRAGILLAVEKTDCKFRPEDVYIRLGIDTAWAYAIEDFGFVVLTKEYDADGLVLFVWIMWAPAQTLGERKQEVYAELERLARECKAKRIRMQSPRRGWEREEFFDRVAVVYEHEVK